VITLKRKRTVSTIFPLWNILRKKRFATIVSALTHTNMAALIAARLSLRSINTLVTEHGSDGLMACASSRLFSCVTRLIYERASAVITVSKNLEQSWRQILSSKSLITTVYNPVVDESFSQTVLPLHPWLLQQNTPVIMGIGRLKPEKNFSLLVRAFARLVLKREARLIILGEGEERAALEKLAYELDVKERVLLPGFVSDVPTWLAQAALLVCPSEREGFGNVVVEALACGVSVVATDCPGPAEILENGRYGRLTPRDDVNAMAQAINETLENKKDPEILRGRAQNFTVTRCVDDYITLIDTLSS